MNVLKFLILLLIQYTCIIVSRLAKALTILIIIIAFAIFPAQVAFLVQAIMSRHHYHGSMPPISKRHFYVCLCGRFDVCTLRKIVSELLNNSMVEKEDIVISILSSIQPSNLLANMLHLASYRRRVRYFIGCCTNHKDLKRIRLNDARVIYVTNDALSSNLRDEEVISIFF